MKKVKLKFVIEALLEARFWRPRGTKRLAKEESRARETASWSPEITDARWFGTAGTIQGGRNENSKQQLRPYSSLTSSKTSDATPANPPDVSTKNWKPCMKKYQTSSITRRDDTWVPLASIYEHAVLLSALHQEYTYMRKIKSLQENSGNKGLKSLYNMGWSLLPNFILSAY